MISVEEMPPVSPNRRNQPYQVPCLSRNLTFYHKYQHVVRCWSHITISPCLCWVHVCFSAIDFKAASTTIWHQSKIRKSNDPSFLEKEEVPSNSICYLGRTGCSGLPLWPWLSISSSRCRPSAPLLWTDWSSRGCTARSQTRALLSSAASDWQHTQTSGTTLQDL